MEITLFVLLSLAGLAAFVAGALARISIMSYLGLGLILIASSANTIEGIYYKSGETEFTNAAGNVTTTVYNYTNYNTTAQGGATDWEIDALGYMLGVFALLALPWLAFREPIGVKNSE